MKSRSKTINKCGLFKNIAIIRLFLQAPVGVVLKDTIQEYLTPSAPAENAEGEQNSATGNSTKEDEEGKLFLKSLEIKPFGIGSRIRDVEAFCNQNPLLCVVVVDCV